jgi:hypothetical protein
MPSHGDREMPVWGRQFLEQDVKVYGPSGGEIVTTERIHNLAGYLETLQQKIPAAAKFANGFLYVYGWIGAGSEAPTTWFRVRYDCCLSEVGRTPWPEFTPGSVWRRVILVKPGQQQRKMYRQPAATGVRFQSDRMQFWKMQEP